MRFIISLGVEGAIYPPKRQRNASKLWIPAGWFSGQSRFGKAQGRKKEEPHPPAVISNIPSPTTHQVLHPTSLLPALSMSSHYRKKGRDPGTQLETWGISESPSVPSRAAHAGLLPQCPLYLSIPLPLLVEELRIHPNDSS